MIKMRLSRYKIVLLLLVLVVIVSMVGCGSSNYNKNTSQDDSNSESGQQYKGDGDANGGFNNSDDLGNKNDSEEDEDSVSTNTNRKVIKSGYIEMETKVFDQAINEIVLRTSVVGGYVEGSNVTGRRINSKGSSENRSASFKLRIPQSRFEDFLLEFGNIGNIILNRSGGDDITFRYYDNEARLKTLEIQEDRLLEILKKAEKVEDIIELERELSDIRYEIENLTGTLKKWDDLISYATLDVQLYEVQEIKEGMPNPTTLGQRIENSFSSSIDALVEIAKGFLVLIAALAPFIVIFVPILGVIIYIIRRATRDNDKKL